MRLFHWQATAFGVSQEYTACDETSKRRAAHNRIARHDNWVFVLLTHFFEIFVYKWRFHTVSSGYFLVAF
jgi:hypothetical protein